MKVTLEFNLPEEQDDAERALNMSGVYCALFDVGQQVFRPARKHGYPEDHISKLLEAADKTTITTEDGFETGAGTQLVRLLEKKFYQILNEYKVDIG